MIRVLVTYDIVDDKRRKKVGDILSGYGIRVNESVFECEFKNKSSKLQMISKLMKILNKKDDSLRIYNICNNCLQQSAELCDRNSPFSRDSVYFI